MRSLQIKKTENKIFIFIKKIKCFNENVKKF